jgi:hypothetical protein
MTENTSGSTLLPAPLCIRFFEGNLDRAFLTTRGLLLPSRSGICSSKIARASQVKKRGDLSVLLFEILVWHDV